MTSKKILREKFLSLRKDSKDLSQCLDNENIVKNTQKLIDSLLLVSNKADKQTDFLDKNKIIGLYWPMKKEVDLIKLAIKFSAITALPKIKGTKMYYVKYDSGSRMEKSEFSKLMQPQKEDKIEPNVFVITSLSLRLAGEGLGLGGGYYDKYINDKSKKRKITKIGVCFHRDLSEYLPREPHDLVLDYVITDKIIIKL